MGAKYTTQTVSGYNAGPPSDDGGQTDANKVKWSTIKTKLADPPKTTLEAMNTALLTALDFSVNQQAANYTTVAGDHMKTVEIASNVSSAITISLGDAATMTNNYVVRVKNSGSAICTIARATSGDTIDGAAANISIGPKQALVFATNSVPDGYLIVAAMGFSSGNVNINGALTVTGNVQLGDATTDSVISQGPVYINDSANGKSTIGLTINQGGSDDEILALKSSDVATSLTDVSETDTYGRAYKVAAGAGGLAVDGISSGTVALYLSGTSPTDNTTKSGLGSARIVLDAYSQTGAARATPGTDSNLVAIRGSGTTVFLFDLEGSAHSEVEWTTFDTMNDVQALDALDLEMQRRNGVQVAFGEWVAESKESLQKHGIVNFYGNGPKAMFNWTRMHMLEVGAIRQLGREKADRSELKALEERLLRIESK